MSTWRPELIACRFYASGKDRVQRYATRLVDANECIDLFSQVHVPLVSRVDDSSRMH